MTTLNAAILGLVPLLTLTQAADDSLRGTAPGSRPGARGPISGADVLVRTRGPALIGPDDTVNTVVVVGHDAAVEGVVREQLVVIDGTARVTGEVGGSLVVVGGRAELGDGARVGGDVLLYGSTLSRAAGATVGGRVERARGVRLGPVFGVLFWLSLTALTLLVGLFLAAVAGRQISEAAALIGRATGPTILAALILALGLPTLAVVAFLSIIGIPVGLVVGMFVIPLLGLLGYVVTGAWLGGLIVGRGRDGEAPPTDRPYRAVLVGVLILQVALIVPFVGGLVLLIATQLGAGALAYRVWRRVRGAAPG